MTIENLEALERAAAEKYDVDAWSEEHLYEINGAVMNALGPLLAVAKAAKAYHDMATSRYDSSRVAEFERKQDELGAALAQLEATP